MTLLQRILSEAADPVGAARARRAAGGRPLVGTVCSWVPPELVDACGADLFRIPLLPGAGGESGAHAQSYSCAYAKGLLDAALAGELDFLDAVVFPTLCDTLQNFADIWRRAVPSVPVVDLWVPANPRSGAAARFLEEELGAFAGKLAALTGRRPADADVDDALARHAARRGAVHELYRRRAGLSNVELYGIVGAADRLSPDEILGASREGRARGGEAVGVFLAGSAVPYPSFFGLLDELSFDVVDDYVCMGRGAWGVDGDGAPPPAGAPLARVAASLLARVEGAARAGDEGGGRWMAHLVASGAPCVLWVLQKYCDPWAWHYGLYSPRIEARGTGSFAVELGGGDGETGYLRGRLEAYAETVRTAGGGHGRR